MMRSLDARSEDTAGARGREDGCRGGGALGSCSSVHLNIIELSGASRLGAHDGRLDGQLVHGGDLLLEPNATDVQQLHAAESAQPRATSMPCSSCDSLSWALWALAVELG